MKVGRDFQQPINVLIEPSLSTSAVKMELHLLQPRGGKKMVSHSR
jgi:hypothetical protein